MKVQEAGRAGLLAGIKGLENAGLDPKEDTNNWQPRIGFAYDLRGDGRDVIRGGWGIYTDMGYTNSNVLFPAIDATGIGSGVVFNVDVPTGSAIRMARSIRFGQPISNIASQNAVESQRIAAHRAVGRSAAPDAVHAAGRVRLVAPVQQQHGAGGGLRAQRRP